MSHLEGLPRLRMTESWAEIPDNIGVRAPG